MIHLLPDDVLLEIFSFYKDDFENGFLLTWKWKTLTQVCRRWRQIIFASPRRLELHVVCTNSIPTGTMDLWPTLPIIVIHNPLDTLGNENIGDAIHIASAKYRGRITRIHLTNINDAELEYLEAVMQQPFPALRHFCLECHPLDFFSVLPPLPDTFLGGFTPRLRSLILEGVSLPTFPRFALSTHIVELRLVNIPPSGYILPEAMATCLSALPKLEDLFIEFRACLDFPKSNQISPPRTTRAILPALTSLWFRSFYVLEYFGDFVTRIDTPN